MKLLIANHSVAVHGGAEQYLQELIPALRARGMAVGVFTEDRSSIPGFPAWSATDDGAQAKVGEWGPAVAFANGLIRPDLDAWLVSSFPTVLFAHNYYGTCVSGEKRHRFPGPAICSRRFGIPCSGLYWSRGCGPLRPGEFLRSFRRQAQRARLLSSYRSIVVASGFMQAEFERHGVRTLQRIPLFVAPPPSDPIQNNDRGPLVFVGRLASTKGVELMLEAVRLARKETGEELPLLILGDGGLRGRLERAIGLSGEPVTLRGWVSSTERDDVLRSARLLLFPSLWPEPFGLAGLEAGRFGVPSVAFAVGGIPEWLEDDRNGVLVSGRELSATAFAAGIVRALSLLRAGPRLRRGAREMADRFRIEDHVERLTGVLQAAAASG